MIMTRTSLNVLLFAFHVLLRCRGRDSCQLSINSKAIEQKVRVLARELFEVLETFSITFLPLSTFREIQEVTSALSTVENFYFNASSFRSSDE